MRVRFAAFTPQVSDTQPPSSAVLAQPRTFFEMVIFSVVVSVTTQVVMHFIFPRR